MTVFQLSVPGTCPNCDHAVLAEVPPALVSVIAGQPSALAENLADRLQVLVLRLNQIQKFAPERVRLPLLGVIEDAVSGLESNV